MSPMAGFQFYGDVKIDKFSNDMTVSLKDIDGNTVYSKELQPEFDRHRFGWGPETKPNRW